MAIDKTRLNGVFYMNKNRELNFRHFDVTYDAGWEVYKSTPNEDYLIVGVYIQGSLVSDQIPNSHELSINHYHEVLKKLSPIETFLCISKRNVYFKVADSSYRTQNSTFSVSISK